MLAAIEDIDVVVFVDADRGNLLERPAGRQLGPVGHHAEFEITATDDHLAPRFDWPSG
jgi:hypothetical protein